jgi:hypothetical protein
MEVKIYLQDFGSKSRDEDIITKIEDYTIKKHEEETCNKVEESLNTNEIKL